MSRSQYVQDVHARQGQLNYDPVWFDIRDHIREKTEGEATPDGIVVTHGSNTVEETGYFLDLTLRTEIPVVLTAAQRWHGMTGDEGPWNLLSAVRVAGHPATTDRGVVLVVNDRRHAVRDVTKVASGKPDAWSSGDHGAIGAVDKRGHVQYCRQTERQTTDTPFELDETARERFPRIAVGYSVAGADGDLIAAAIDRGVDGIVVAGFPTGDPAAVQQSALERATEEGIPVVMSHRGLYGWSTREHLNENDLFIWADDLSPQKARILLAVSLLVTDDPNEIQQFFRKY
jgi:L-asparaginase